MTEGDTLEMYWHYSTDSTDAAIKLEDQSGRHGDLAFEGKGIFPVVAVSPVSR